MAVDPRSRLEAGATRRLSLEEAKFYANVYASARSGCLNDMRAEGLSEEEAEELFSRAFEKVMRRVDPIERGFSEAQMVSYIKRACARCLIDERRRAGVREQSYQAMRALLEEGGEEPALLAERREAVAIGREALQTLPARDQVVFRARYQMELSPEEIIRGVPGLSQRSYRRVIERANARVLAAYEAISSGERCAEMEHGQLRRYVTGEGPAAERATIEAHLEHCRSCALLTGQMRSHLHEVASGLLVGSSLVGGDHSGAFVSFAGRLLDTGSGALHGLGEASRAVRERIREALLRIPGVLPGADGGAGVGQALGASSVKIASVCAAGVAAGACVATGVLPGIAGVSLIDHGAPAKHRPVRSAETQTTTAVPPSAPTVTASPQSSESSAAAHPHHGRNGQRGERSRKTATGKGSSPATSSPEAEPSPTPSIEEFGPESASSPSSGGSSPSTGAARPASGGGGGSGGGSGGGGAPIQNGAHSGTEFGP